MLRLIGPMFLTYLDIWIEPSSLPAWGGDVSGIEHQAFEAIACRSFRAPLLFLIWLRFTPRAPSSSDGISSSSSGAMPLEGTRAPTSVFSFDVYQAQCTRLDHCLNLVCAVQFHQHIVDVEVHRSLRNAEDHPDDM